MKFSTLTSIIGLSAAVLSQSIWAQCTTNRNVSIVITKPDSIYIDHLNGTVTDTETGLQWQKCSLGQTWNAGADANTGSDDSCDGTAVISTWQSALAKANDNVLVVSDWRLPNKNELKSLVEGACYNPAINESLFPNTVSASYWSASPYAGNDSYAWIVYFSNGSDSADLKNVSSYVRLVRGSNL